MHAAGIRFGQPYYRVDEETHTFIEFFPDGSCKEVVMSGTSPNWSGWFSGATSGRYETAGTTIHGYFTMPDIPDYEYAGRRATFEGGADPAGDLTLRWKHVTGKRAVTTYRWWGARSSEPFLPNEPSTEEPGSPGVESNDSRSTDEVLAELDGLVGLVPVKAEIRSLCNLHKLNYERRARGLPGATVSLHVVFAGPPGTGKTTVARLYAELLCSIGLLPTGRLTEAARQDLVGEYIGHTAVKTNDLIDKAIGGVLFIDEAYSLAPEDSGRDFGREAIEVLLKRMEDDRHHLAVVAAGYTREMKRFIEANPGLDSRFGQTIEFPSYDREELVRIFEGLADSAGFLIAPGAREAARRNLEQAWSARDERFGNGRYVRRLFEVALRRQADRLAGEAELSAEQLTTTQEADVPVFEWKP